MRFLVWVLVNAVALAIATLLLSGITLTAQDAGGRIGSLVGVALVFGVLNAVIRPVIKLLTLPLILLTLGLLVLVINACMLLLTSWVSGRLGLGFHVSGFWTAVVGGLVVAVATWVLELVLREDRR